MKSLEFHHFKKRLKYCRWIYALYSNIRIFPMTSRCSQKFIEIFHMTAGTTYPGAWIMSRYWDVKKDIENLGWLYAHRTLARAPVEPSTLSLHAIMRRPPEWNVTKSPIMLSITGKTDKDDNRQLCFPPAWDVRWSSNQHCLAYLLKPVLRASVRIRKGSERAV